MGEERQGDSQDIHGTARLDRPTPTWYDDAKLGIFVHWGLYSVPGWATTTGTLDEAGGRFDWETPLRSIMAVRGQLTSGNSKRAEGSGK